MSQTKKDLAWLIDSGYQTALLWERLDDDVVRCQLCPRMCQLKPGSFGFCKARFNHEGELQTAIWGKLMLPGIEPIETEAVFHYWPGAKVLSLGNLGCNLDCDFCQNWESSSMLRLDPKYVIYKTPEQIVDLAQALNINVISFTYNDPAIWFEFLRDTASLARERGMKTLFKSAGYVSNEAARGLTEVIDIFSMSLKTINPKTFARISKGKLEPVLEGIKIFHESESHLEVSNLIVTGINDIEDEVRQLAQWVRDECSPYVPVHFVRFHPAYKYTEVERTPIDFLEKCRAIGLEEGLKYVYIGNTYREGHADILCKKCGNLLVKRFGLYTKLPGITQDGKCVACGDNQDIVIQPAREARKSDVLVTANGHSVWKWSNVDTRNLHVQVHNSTSNEASLSCEHLDDDGKVMDQEIFRIPASTDARVAVGQMVEQEKEVLISYPPALNCYVKELEDRAHFPLEGLG